WEVVLERRPHQCHHGPARSDGGVREALRQPGRRGVEVARLRGLRAAPPERRPGPVPRLHPVEFRGGIQRLGQQRRLPARPQDPQHAGPGGDGQRALVLRRDPAGDRLIDALRTFHANWAWVVVIGNALAGLVALAAWRAPRLRGRWVFAGAVARALDPARYDVVPWRSPGKGAGCWPTGPGRRWRQGSGRRPSRWTGRPSAWPRNGPGSARRWCASSRAALRSGRSTSP